MINLLTQCKIDIRVTEIILHSFYLHRFARSKILCKFIENKYMCRADGYSAWLYLIYWTVNKTKNKQIQMIKKYSYLQAQTHIERNNVRWYTYISIECVWWNPNTTNLFYSTRKRKILLLLLNRRELFNVAPSGTKNIIVKYVF